jgi:hypothetical protein
VLKQESASFGCVDTKVSQVSVSTSVTPALSTPSHACAASAKVPARLELSPLEARWKLPV